MLAPSSFPGPELPDRLQKWNREILFILVPGIAMLKSAAPKKALPSDIEQGYLLSGGPRPHGLSVPSFGTACYVALNWLLPCFPSLNTQSIVSTMRDLPCPWKAVPGLTPGVNRTAAPTPTPAQTSAQLAGPVPWAPLPSFWACPRGLEDTFPVLASSSVMNPFVPGSEQDGLILDLEELPV